MIEFCDLFETYARSKGFLHDKRMDLDPCSWEVMIGKILHVESTAQQPDKRRYKLEYTLGRDNLLEEAKCLLRIQCAYRIDQVERPSSSLCPDHRIDIIIRDTAIECDELE